MFLRVRKRSKVVPKALQTGHVPRTPPRPCTGGEFATSIILGGRLQIKSMHCSHQVSCAESVVRMGRPGETALMPFGND
jgi:hypothetical protein